MVSPEVIGADFNGHVRACNRGDEEVMARVDIQGRNAEGQMVVDILLLLSLRRDGA